jgi:hypothetical protein
MAVTGATGATGPAGVTGSAGPGVPAGGTAKQVLSKIDGTNYNTQWVDAIYDIALSTDDAAIYANNQVILRHAPAHQFVLKAGLFGARGGCVVAPTGSISVNIKKNGSNVGSIDIAASATSATFTFSSDVTFTTSDTLTIVAPASADVTLAGVYATLPGIRQ